MFENKASGLKSMLEQMLNDGQPKPDRSNTRSKGSRQSLRQELLDALADTGASTNNHVHSRDVPVANPAVDNLLDLAESIRRQREAEPGQLAHRIAGEGDLNSSFKNLENYLNNNGGY
ncbi:hypothetical protein [Nocardia puris]|uniref:Uncharacterized protein n=1 Tax=Nocardia puris TaxID=208602 RepID=A0A366DHP7_9NOCA|nr:hypothetical protein [Nocardia puris]RBO88778.1 hypothetical protein DFR74_1082 [Nocardia puris]